MSNASRDLEELSEEEYRQIGEILERGDARRHAEDLLAAFASRERQRQGLEEDPLHELLRQAHQDHQAEDTRSPE